MLAWILALGLAASMAGTWLSALTRGPTRKLAVLTGAIAVVAVIAGRDDLGLQKLASTAVMPLGLLWIALAALTLWAYALKVKPLALALLATWLALGISGNGWVAGALAEALESTVETPPLPDAPFDAIFVPGGGAGFNSQGEPQLYDYGDRVALAARLYNAGHTRVLVTTGSAIESISHAQDLTQATRVLWQQLGVPADAIVGLSEPKNTSQEIEASKRLIVERAWTRVGIIGSAFHLPRIMSLCARHGLDAIPIAADRRGGSPVLHPLVLVPTATSMRTTSLVAWELLGMLMRR